ncbi:MAG: hypothetical protein QG652_1594 [Pseudomonadota bacterium]|nr:hypothetical protein [Pseudomonadota bacterium]
MDWRAWPHYIWANARIIDNNWLLGTYIHLDRRNTINPAENNI